MGVHTYRGKLGQLTPWKNGRKIKKQKHAKKEQVSNSNFHNFLCLRRQGGIDPLTKILRTFLPPVDRNNYNTVRQRGIQTNCNTQGGKYDLPSHTDTHHIDSLHVTCGLTACTPGSAPGPTLCNEYGKTLPFLQTRQNYDVKTKTMAAKVVYKSTAYFTLQLLLLKVKVAHTRLPSVGFRS